MQLLSFKVPGKAFILGEYSCLLGYPALVVSFPPYFELVVKRDSHFRECQHSFHPASPAAHLIENFSNSLKGHVLEWHDPYPQLIGVGSSTAQFLAVHSFLRKIEPRLSSSDLLSDYWSASGVDKNTQVRPSGVDLLAQQKTGFILVSSPHFTEMQMPESDEVEWVLIFTGQKQKTHEHLEYLKRLQFPGTFQSTLVELNDATYRGILAMQEGDWPEVGKVLNQFQKMLEHSPLELSQEWRGNIEAIQSVQGVLGCKGSGAQGGDCFIALIAKEHRVSIEAFIQKKGFQFYSLTTAMSHSMIALKKSSRGLNEMDR